MAHLPINRVKTIMKTTDGADSISKEAIFIVKAATESFIKQLASEGYANTKGGKKLNYNNLVSVVHNTSCYEFLEYMIPKKITVRRFKELMRRKEAAGSESSEEEQSSSSEEESEDSGEQSEEKLE